MQKSFFLFFLLRDHDHGFLQKVVLQRKRGESLAQMHIFLKLVIDLAMEMVGMREQSVQSPDDRVQALSLVD